MADPAGQEARQQMEAGTARRTLKTAQGRHSRSEAMEAEPEAGRRKGKRKLRSTTNQAVRPSQ